MAFGLVLGFMAGLAFGLSYMKWRWMRWLELEAKRRRDLLRDLYD